MRAAVLTAPRVVELMDVPDPVVGPGEALVDVLSVGICGSDLSTYRGHHPFRRPPVVLGHEMVGRVRQAPDDRLRPGDLVVLEPLASCGECAYCREDRPNLCSDRRVPGVGLPGMLAEQVALPVDLLHLLDSADVGSGSLVEPVAVALRAVRRGGCRPGHRVAVVGAGSIGALAALLAADRVAADQVLALDVSAFGLDLVSRVAGCRTQRLTAGSAEQPELPAGSCDLVLLGAGHPDSVATAVQLLRPGGRLVTISLFGGPVTLQMDAITVKEIEVVGSYVDSRNDFADAVQLVAGSTMPFGALITDRAPLSQAADVLRRIDDGFDHGKVVIDVANGTGDR